MRWRVMEVWQARQGIWAFEWLVDGGVKRVRYGPVCEVKSTPLAVFCFFPSSDSANKT